MKVSVKVEKKKVSLTSTARLSLRKFEQAAVFLQHTSPAGLSQNVLLYPHDVADTFFHTYDFKKGKKLPSFFSPFKQGSTFP